MPGPTQSVETEPGEFVEVRTAPDEPLAVRQHRPKRSLCQQLEYMANIILASRADVKQTVGRLAAAVLVAADNGCELPQNVVDWYEANSE